MSTVEDNLRELIKRELEALKRKDVELLLTIFHEDMVWAWPRSFNTANPFYWEMDLGRFNYERWYFHWKDFFEKFEILHAVMMPQKINLSAQEDAAFAVIDLHFQWESKTNGEIVEWRGRVCKVYTRMEKSWKLIQQTGLIPYRSFDF